MYTKSEKCRTGVNALFVRIGLASVRVNIMVLTEILAAFPSARVWSPGVAAAAFLYF